MRFGSQLSKLALSAILFLIIASAAYSQEHPASSSGYTVTRVVDGDTLHATHNGADLTIRLIGIDTPETHGKGGLRECYGQQASDYTTRLLPPGTKIDVERDTEQFDRYGRTLAYIHRSKDNMFVNLNLAKMGYATDLSIAPNTEFETEFETAVQLAKKRNAGLWGACGSPDVKIN